MSKSQNIENNLLFIERKRLYDYSEKKRIVFKLDDKELINFGIFCAKYSMKSHDWRFVNLSLKILDSKRVLGNKINLKKETQVTLNYLKKKFL